MSIGSDNKKKQLITYTYAFIIIMLSQDIIMTQIICLPAEQDMNAAIVLTLQCSNCPDFFINYF